MKTRAYYAGKHAAITGGSEGIGLALAKQLTQLGCKVSICSRSAAKLEAAKQEVLQLNAAAQLATFPMDVTDEGQVWTCQMLPSPACHPLIKLKAVPQVLKAVESCKSAFGPVDILICCAGGATCGELVQQQANALVSVAEV